MIWSAYGERQSSNDICLTAAEYRLTFAVISERLRSGTGGFFFRHHKGDGNPAASEALNSVEVWFCRYNSSKCIRGSLVWEASKVTVVWEASKVTAQ